MKLQLHSDLHIEMKGYFSIPKVDSDLIVLAGDIDVGMHGIEWAEELTRLHDKPVIYLAGNHEYYHHDHTELTQAFRDYAARYDKLHFLEKDELLIGDIRILATTLWTNYYHELGGIERGKNITLLDDALNDHRLITLNKDRFSAARAYEENQRAELWLKQKLAIPFEGKTIIITHHAPSRKCNHRHFGESLYSPGFVSNLDELVKQTDLWLYGHTHSNEDLTIGQCRVVSNQKGYPHEKAAGNPYRPDLLIEI